MELKARSTEKLRSTETLKILDESSKTRQDKNLKS